MPSQPYCRRFTRTSRIPLPCAMFTLAAPQPRLHGDSPRRFVTLAKSRSVDSTTIRVNRGTVADSDANHHNRPVKPKSSHPPCDFPRAFLCIMRRKSPAKARGGQTPQKMAGSVLGCAHARSPHACAVARRIVFVKSGRL